MSKEIKTFELLCRFIVDEMNKTGDKQIAEDYFYNEKYETTIVDKITFEKFATTDIKKALEVLQIIKEKEVDIHNFKYLIVGHDWSYEEYLDEESDQNTSGHQFAYEKLTEEEFNLLRWYLSNE